MNDFHVTRRVFVGAACFGLAARQAHAQAWQPQRPISFIVAYGAGGSADVLARVLAKPVSEALGVQVVVDNVSGASGMLGMTKLARAKPDGYTIGMGAAGTNAIMPALYSDQVQYRSPQDFTPILRLSDMANVFMVSVDAPVKTPNDFVDWLRAHPGATYGIAGIGTSNHLTAEMLAHQLKLQLTPVPYRSNPQATLDLIGGRIMFTVDNSTTAIPQHLGGKARAVAVSSPNRLDQLPDVPTLAETVAPGFNATAWQGLFGPAGLPAPIVERLHAEFAKALNTSEVKRSFESAGLTAGGGSPQSFAKFVDDEIAKWGGIVKSANIKPQ